MSNTFHCPYCDALVASTGAVHEDASVRYTLYACSVCAIQHWRPFKNPGSSWYEHDIRYADRNRDPILMPSWGHSATVRYFGKGQRKVLDVGCGVGNFLAHARRFGWSGWGIDFDADAIAAGKRAFGLPHLEVASLTDFAERHPEERFSLVTFFDVIEHLDDPNDFLASVESVLESRGSIALTTPYRHGWRWLLPNDLPPRHLSRFDDVSLGTYLQSRGYRIDLVMRYPASIYFIALKLKSRYGRWASMGVVKASLAQQKPGEKGKGKVRALKGLAKVKDLALFGIPALIIYIVLLPTNFRYTDFLIIASRNE